MNYRISKLNAAPTLTRLALLLAVGCEPYKIEYPDDCEETWYADADGDGYGDASTSVEDCEAPEGAVANGDDCDDSAASVHPDAEELCNGADENCDGEIDDGLDSTWYTDADGDGAGDPSTAVLACEAPAGSVDHAGDCDDADAAVIDCDLSGSYALADVSDAVIIGEQSGDLAGYSVGFAGDTNGDGVDDVLVATNQTNNGQGGVYVVHGPVSGEVDLADADAVMRQQDNMSVGNTLRGVGAVGDLDADGYTDVAAGDFMAPDAESGIGTIWVWTGPQSGARDLEDADISVSGDAASDVVGTDPAVSVDINGDGELDLVVSSIRARSGPGGAYAFLGPLSGDYTLAGADSAVLGTDSTAQVGSAVGSGDFDGDGQVDLAIGARYTEVSARAKSGAVYIVSGPQDGMSDVADADGGLLSDLAGAQLGDEVLGADDMDGDGYDDLLASAPFDGAGPENPGALYLFSGPLDGTRTSADASARIGAASSGALSYAPFDAGDLNLDGAGDLIIADSIGSGWGRAMLVYGPVAGNVTVDDGGADAIFEGDDLTASWIVDAAIGGDANGDGWTDLLIGAGASVGGSSSETLAGRAHLIFGGP